MSELAGCAEFSREGAPKLISHTAFFNMRFADLEGDFDAAVASIETAEEALLFSAGLAKLEEMYERTDSQNSGRCALDIIDASLERQLGPGVSNIKDMWRGALSHVIFGKETPGIWQYLVDGTDFEAVGLDETIDFSKQEYEEAGTAFKSANKRLAEVSDSL
ncbi:hypothetical protein KY385_00635 [Candidatus Parcubacteria bacterium]|nr:hypothetical protein [Candidatus Parcubacteria bacterium]